MKRKQIIFSLLFIILSLINSLYCINGQSASYPKTFTTSMSIGPTDFNLIDVDFQINISEKFNRNNFNNQNLTVIITFYTLKNISSINSQISVNFRFNQNEAWIGTFSQMKSATECDNLEKISLVYGLDLSIISLPNSKIETVWCRIDPSISLIYTSSGTTFAGNIPTDWMGPIEFNDNIISQIGGFIKNFSFLIILLGIISVISIVIVKKIKKTK
ncbi:MAG: hypothetical protein ACTSVL_04175 [Promethearchaeota archaeon]